MHYKNKRVAQLGDKVVGINSCGQPVAGILCEATPENTSCNGIIVPMQKLHENGSLVTINECMHLDDTAVSEHFQFGEPTKEDDGPTDEAPPLVDAEGKPLSE